ncbi:MAG: flippase-like domain-containing protein [Bacteroidales bacterium]|jgi:hypothetical protein|nr:flippase-like domain-containing protein [Bacteroidales bacterium]
MKINKRLKKWLILVIKILIIIFSFYFAIYKIVNSCDLIDFKQNVFYFDFNRFFILFLLLIFMFINWFFEAVKWKISINSLEKINVWKSLKAVWTGVTVGTITPNRIGEFGGKIIFLKKENQVSAIPYTFVADLSQLLITVCCGIIGFALLIPYLHFLDIDFQEKYNLICIIALIITIFLVSLFLFIDKLFNKLLKIVNLKKEIIKNVAKIQIKFSEKIKMLLFSFIRYLIFNFQFYLALKYFGIEIGIFHSLIASSSMYLCVNIIPNLPFLEIGLRSSFSIIFFELFTTQTTVIVCASLLIYIINIFIPIIIGSGFLVKHK